jgi:muramoyltetrapeptide carboxypeptidase LdcA involved in peptidoglycan recycling
MGVFDQVAGVLLGTFSKYEEAALSLSVFDLLKMHISDTLPVVKTTEIGHRPDSKAIVIGRNMKLKKGDLWQIH